MAAPTPVSSLVHSSTLVTAGVYLLLRFNFLLDRVYSFFSFLSIITILVSALGARLEQDFKKIVALSTLSQLGFIVFCICQGFWVLRLIHVIIHAFFKSSLFLATGRLIHSLLGGQDCRIFGSLGGSYFSKIVFIVRSLRMCGFPFLLGFYSKDSILGVFLSNGVN